MTVVKTMTVLAVMKMVNIVTVERVVKIVNFIPIFPGEYFGLAGN